MPRNISVTKMPISAGAESWMERFIMVAKSFTIIFQRGVFMAKRVVLTRPSTGMSW